jgi:hypothetical protein
MIVAGSTGRAATRKRTIDDGPSELRAVAVTDVQTMILGVLSLSRDITSAGPRAYGNVSVKTWEAWSVTLPAAAGLERRDDSASRDE